MSLSFPICFRPWLRPMPWGGTALAPLLGLPVTDEAVGEAWLLSDHVLHHSIVSRGDYEGQSLQQLMTDYGEQLLGYPARRFPLLIKILDAEQNLSVQVHPDDELARIWAPREGGKTEAWHVLATRPAASIYLGLKSGFNKETFARELASGNTPLCLKRYEPQTGETYYVPAGTVHALGQGVVALEVQQTSDATFRLYDWGRIGADGQPRELHLEAGLACSRESPSGAGLQESITQHDNALKLVECDFFTLRQWKGPGEYEIPAPCILFQWQGSLTVPGLDFHLSSSETCLIPATMEPRTFEADAHSITFEISWPLR